jgi:molecular chaperone GrpE
MTEEKNIEEKKENNEVEEKELAGKGVEIEKKVDVKKDIKKFFKKAEKKESKEEEYLLGWRRCMADFENYKKRQQENQKSLGEYVKEDFVLQIIPVIDNFHSATEHIPEEQKNVPWVVGIMYIQKQLEDVLKENGVTEIPVKVGDEFDPNLHEAVASNPAYAEASTSVKTPADKPAGKQETVNLPTGQAGSDQEAEKKELENKIKKVVLKGYKLGEKVIRAARVIVE